MAPAPSTPRHTARGRPRGRPKGPGSVSASRSKRIAPDGPATEPPPKKRRYIPGGPGGGGRFVDEDGTEIPAESHGPSTTVSRPRLAAATQAQATPSVYPPRREPSRRIRTAVNRDERDDMQYSSAAAVAAAVVQSEGYKPREERGWEEFHPNLDIEATFMVYQADEVDGVIRSVPPTPAVHASGTLMNGGGTPTKEANPGLANGENGTPSGQGKPFIGGSLVDTPSRRRVGRPARESFSLYATRTLDSGPKVPKVLPISGQTSKERLDLKAPQYRRTNRIALFESKTFGQARYVDKSMMNVGYQESDNFIRPDRNLIKATDANMEEDAELCGAAGKADGDAVQHPAGVVGRVEYDMDEQDDMWLEKLNAQRKAADLDPITREIFEITITKIEKEWHALEKRIPKPNPKPPQTHRPRSSSAAAVNGEPQAGEEQDSKCAICDDGDCENTNAIVFCDGCDLAVHQECYGVPFIPEGQWLCRKCQLIGRGIPTCIFCPNTDGAFKQTNSSKWAHLLCAMWIPEVSLGNHTFMEPVMEVEKVPKTRWRLTCYICSQRMGACIQCSNKNCYQAFHVTCARRCRLFLKMKNNQGALAVLDGSPPLKAFCDKHCPENYAEENGVARATKEAKRFYKRTMKNRIWADSQASALQLAAAHRNAITEHPPDESQLTGAKVSAVLADKKKGQPPKNVWKLPSGAPVIPQAVYDLVESALARFPIRKRKDFVGEACKYWTLKREARRGAALLKRLQLQMETFTSMELTRRDFAAMGSSGRARLDRRIEFARMLEDDLAKLKELCELVRQREAIKLELAEIEADMIHTCYFPIAKELRPILDKAIFLDKNVFKEGFQQMQNRMDKLHYVTAIPFARDLCQVIHVGINKPPAAQEYRAEPVETTPSKYNNFAEIGARKRLGKRILKLLQPHLEDTLKAETEITRQPYEPLHKILEAMLEASVEVRPQPATSIMVSDAALSQDQDVDMTDAPAEGQIIVADHSEGVKDAEAELDGALDDTNIEVGGGYEHDEITPKPNGVLSTAQSVSDEPHLTNGFFTNTTSKPSTAPASQASLPGASYTTHFSSRPDQHTLNNNTGGEDTGPLTPPRSNTGSASAASFTMTVPNNNNNPIITVTNATTPPAAAAAANAPASSSTTAHNPLTDGGIMWYLADFQLVGTTAVDPDGVVSDDDADDGNGEGEDGDGDGDEKWTHGREAALRSLSEELTDLDDEALRDLGVGVDVDVTVEADAHAGGDEGKVGDDGDDADDAGGDDVVMGDGIDDDRLDDEADEMTITFAGDGASNADGNGAEASRPDGVVNRRDAATAIAAAAAAGSGGGNAQQNGSPAVAKKAQTVVAGSGGGAGGSPRKRTRSEVAAAAAASGRGRFSLRSRSAARRK